MAIQGNIGATVTLQGEHPHALLFGENQARYLVTVADENLSAFLEDAIDAGISTEELGKTGGKALIIGDKISIPVKDMSATFEGWFQKFMETE